MPRPRRRRPWRRRKAGWAFPAPRCWCGWYPAEVPGRKDPSWIGHAHTCPVAHFGWITSPEQLAAQRLLLMVWAEAMERASSHPEYLLASYQGDWRAVLDTWQNGLTNAAVRHGWEGW